MAAACRPGSPQRSDCTVLLLQEGTKEAPQKRKRWLLSKAKQGIQQLQKLNLAFQDWTERLWKASLLCSVGSNHCPCHNEILLTPNAKFWQRGVKSFVKQGLLALQPLV